MRRKLPWLPLPLAAAFALAVCLTLDLQAPDDPLEILGPDASAIRHGPQPVPTPADDPANLSTDARATGAISTCGPAAGGRCSCAALGCCPKPEGAQAGNPPRLTKSLAPGDDGPH